MPVGLVASGSKAAMPGQSGLCKNRECVNAKTGKRRQMRSGTGGYCLSCAKTHAPDLAAKCQADERARYLVCESCQAQQAKVTEEGTERRLCKGCAKEMQPPRCLYCRQEGGELTRHGCVASPGCRQGVLLCTRCEELVGEQKACHVCCLSVLGNGCVFCRGVLPTLRGGRHLWRHRFCQACYLAHFVVDEAMPAGGGCYHCHTTGHNCGPRACTYDEACGGSVVVCDRCVSLQDRVVCAVCYTRDWGGLCLRCIERTAQRKQGDKDYGHFCIACAAIQTDEGADEANDADVAAL